METLLFTVDFFLHLDKHLAELVRDYGNLTYAILFIIIFSETGFVITPFLPGDSLLFAAGAIASVGSLNPHSLSLLLTIAAIVGDSVNYAIGNFLGPKVLANPDSRIFKREYLEKTHRFYERYGGKTIVIARFVPIVRTFAPFLAGVGAMTYSKFLAYNIVGGILWVASFVYAGYYFGEIPVVKRNFTLVIIAIILLSIMPAIVEYLRAKKASSVPLRG